MLFTKISYAVPMALCPAVKTSWPCDALLICAKDWIKTWRSSGGYQQVYIIGVGGCIDIKTFCPKKTGQARGE
jgi:hypothetical protein